MTDIIKEGNKLICRKTVLDEFSNQELFIEGDEYEIIYAGVYIISIDDNLKQEWHFTIEENDPAYIWKTFIPIAEWRDKQIDLILND
jgi:hypothetical protein